MRRIALRRANLNLCQTVEAQWIWLPPKRPLPPSGSPAEEAPKGQSLPITIFQSCQDASAAQLLAWLSNLPLCVVLDTYVVFHPDWYLLTTKDYCH